MTPPRDLADAQQHRPNWAGWQLGDEGPTCSCGFNGTHIECRDFRIADAQDRLDRIRDYAQELRDLGLQQVRIGRPYDALPYDNTAAALERIIGG